jgi:hypothetical protein
MPLASYTPEAPSGVVVNIPKIVSPETKGIVVDTKYTPLASLISFVTGSSWTVDYYSQIINKDNDIRGQDVGQSSVYQQYTRIRGLEIKVNNPLSQNQNNDDKRTVVQGTATVYPLFIPNEGDMFCADVGDGREGVFRVKSSEKKSYLEQATYVIDYDLVYYAAESVSRKADLDAKSVRTLYYVKDFLTYGQNPLLGEEQFNAIGELGSLFNEMVQNYFNWFYSNEFRTLIVPGQPLEVYDHYLTEAVLSILSTRDHVNIKNIKKLNIDGDEYLKQPQLYKALVSRDYSLVALGNTEMGLVNTKLFSRDPWLEGIAYGGIKFLVYPTKPDTSFNSLSSVPPKTVSDNKLVPVSTRPGNITQTVTSVNVETTPGQKKDFHLVLDDHSYVFSKAFYEQDDTGKSNLELLVSDYFDRKAIDTVRLSRLAATYKNWGGLERFYLIPILLILIRTTIRNT